MAIACSQRQQHLYGTVQAGYPRLNMCSQFKSLLMFPEPRKYAVDRQDLNLKILLALTKRQWLMDGVACCPEKQIAFDGPIFVVDLHAAPASQCPKLSILPHQKLHPKHLSPTGACVCTFVKQTTPYQTVDEYQL